MRFGGKRIVDVLADSGAELTQDERDLLAAHRNSRSSLFVIVSADSVACQIKLRDPLQPSTLEVALTDINLSRCSATKPGEQCLLRFLGQRRTRSKTTGVTLLHRVSPSGCGPRVTAQIRWWSGHRDGLEVPLAQAAQSQFGNTVHSEQ